MSAVIEHPSNKDRRGAHGTRCLRQARCAFKLGYGDVDVTLRSASELGAQIEGPGSFWLPERFELHIHNGFGAYAKRPVRLVWSRGDVAGVQFLDAGPPAA